MVKPGSKLEFCCPKCKGELVVDKQAAKCKNGHSYDESKYGYYNLFLTNVGGTHGDNKEMVLARRAFLGGEYYKPLLERLCELVLRYTRPGGLLVDAGCGEGYYTNAIENALFARDNHTRVAAFDISKDAVRQLVKKNHRICAAVAGAYDMPVADGCVATVVNTFSPFAADEIIRTLEDDGILVMAIPESDHLYELKQILYKTPYKNVPKDPEIAGLRLEHDERVSFVMQLDGKENILSLFKMTPYAYRTPKECASRLESLNHLDCTADFRLFVYRKVTQASSQSK